VAPAREVGRVMQAQEQVREVLGERLKACMWLWEVFCVEDGCVLFVTACAA
jgi:hypothetical protein